MKRATNRAALVAGIGLALVWATPAPAPAQQQQQEDAAAGQECEPRLSRLEQVAQRLNLPLRVRTDVERHLQSAGALLENEDTDGCARVLAEAERLVQQPVGPGLGRRQPAALDQVVERLDDGGGGADEGSAAQTTDVPAAGSQVGQAIAERERIGAVDAPEGGAAAGPGSVAAVEPAIPLLRREPEEILGADVVSARGEEIAEIEGIVRRRGGDALHAVLEVGGFLGVGEKEVAIPLSAFELGPEGEIVLPQVAEDELGTLPDYDEAEFEETGLED